MSALIQAFFALCRQIGSMRAVGDTLREGVAPALSNAAAILGAFPGRVCRRKQSGHGMAETIVMRKRTLWLIRRRSRQ